MQEIESAAFARGISAADLMEQAGAGIASAIWQFFPDPGTAVLYLGKGNNAGDALVAARHLRTKGWTLWARLSSPPDDLKPLPRKHFLSLGEALQIKPGPLTPDDFPPGPVITLDGLLGIGALGPLSTSLAGLADFWSQSLWAARLDLPESSSASSIQVRFHNSGGKRYLRAEGHLVYPVTGTASRVTFAWQDSAGQHQQTQLLDHQQDWTLPTQTAVETLWVEIAHP